VQHLRNKPLFIELSVFIVLGAFAGDFSGKA
jgi:hypothetical protein